MCALTVCVARVSGCKHTCVCVHVCVCMCVYISVCVCVCTTCTCVCMYLWHVSSVYARVIWLQRLFVRLSFSLACGCILSRERFSFLIVFLSDRTGLPTEGGGEEGGVILPGM